MIFQQPGLAKIVFLATARPSLMPSEILTHYVTRRLPHGWRHEMPPYLLCPLAQHDVARRGSHSTLVSPCPFMSLCPFMSFAPSRPLAPHVPWPFMSSLPPRVILAPLCHPERSEGSAFLLLAPTQGRRFSRNDSEGTLANGSSLKEMSDSILRFVSLLGGHSGSGPCISRGCACGG